jgi:hypothetical protein
VVDEGKEIKTIKAPKKWGGAENSRKRKKERERK